MQNKDTELAVISLFRDSSSRMMESLQNYFQSKSKLYVNNFIKLQRSIKADIIEIHNRPNYLKYIKKLNSKIVLYFHNDPLSMKGSKSIKERLHLLNSVHKIIFVSKWTQNRFFKDMDKKLVNKTNVVYPSIHKEN